MNNTEVCIMRKIELNADEQLIDEASKIFKELGLDLSTGIDIYLKQVIDKRGIPFEVTLEGNDSELGLEDLKNNRTESFDSLDDLIDEVNPKE